MSIGKIIEFLAGIVAVVFVFAPHEYAHAWVAYKNGDATAKMQGRLTLNPIKHIDPVGWIACALVGFGWAKPVPVNPANFKHFKKGMFTTAVAGVITNYIIAFIAYLIYVLLLRYVYFENLIYLMQNDGVFYLFKFISDVFFLIFAYSLCSFVFNLLPLYPLDGFRVVEAFTRQVNPVQRFLREYGNLILTVLIVESFICSILDNYVGWSAQLNILGYFMQFATDILGFPIQKAWDWILFL